jgi:hypothetical protein
MKYRDIEFGVKQIEQSKWRWTIYWKIELHAKVIGQETYESRDQAIAACKKEIDHGLDQKEGIVNAQRT